MKIKSIRVFERFWSAPDSEKYVLKIKLYGSQKEIEEIKDTIFNSNLEKEA